MKRAISLLLVASTLVLAACGCRCRDERYLAGQVDTYCHMYNDTPERCAVATRHLEEYRERNGE